MDEITRTLIPENGFGGGSALALAHKIRNM